MTGEISTVKRELLLLLLDLVVVRLLFAAAKRIMWTMPLDRLAVSILEDSLMSYSMSYRIVVHKHTLDRVL